MNHKIKLQADDGLDYFVVQELKQRFNLTAKPDNVVETTLDKAYELMYYMQTIKGCILLLHKQKFTDLEEIKLPSKEIIEIVQNQTCKIEVERQGEHNFNSTTAEKILGVKLQQQAKTNYDFKNPEVTIKVIIKQDTCFIGIDLAGRDLSKRQYKLFNHPVNIKSTIAFSALILAGLDKTVLDPYSLSGTIPIESAIYKSKTPVNYYDDNFNINRIQKFNVEKIKPKIERKPKKTYSTDDNFKNLSAQKKNAKVAGVDKFIEFSRYKLEDLDLKFHEEKPDVIVTMPLEQSKRISQKASESYQKELFKIADEILNEKILVLITKKKLTPYLGYKVTEEFEVKQGKQTMYIVRCQK